MGRESEKSTTGRHVTVAFDSSLAELAPPALRQHRMRTAPTGVVTLLQLKEYSRVFEVKGAAVSEEAKKTLKRLLVISQGAVHKLQHVSRRAHRFITNVLLVD